MKIVRHSKTIKELNNQSGYWLQYHKTKVIIFERKTRKLMLDHAGWETMNTARAMNFGLEELGLTGYRVNRKQGRLYLTFPNGVTHLLNERYWVQL